MGKRLYSLFERPRNARKGTAWTRISPLALSKASAIRVFQSALLNAFFDPQRGEVALRPVPPEKANVVKFKMADYEYEQQAMWDEQ